MTIETYLVDRIKKLEHELSRYKLEMSKLNEENNCLSQELRSVQDHCMRLKGKVDVYEGRGVENNE